MKLFNATRRGIIMAFGFNMMARKPEPQMICWTDPHSGSWDWEETWEQHPNKMTGQQGYLMIKGVEALKPEFIFEADEGRIIAYQPGVAIELTYVNLPMIWSCRLLRPE